MARPTVSDVHREAILESVSIAYRNEAYLYPQVFPEVQVEKKSDYYYIFGRGAWFRDEVGIRAPGTKAKRVDYTLTSASYNCINYAIAHPIPDEVRDNADAPLQPDVNATEFTTDALMRAQERRVATIITASDGWAYAASPTIQWSSDTSNPWGDIIAAVNGVVQQIGRRPNVAVVSWDVWRYLMNHPDFLDRIKHTKPSGMVEPADVANWFQFDKFLIGYSLYEKAMEGQTASMTYIWDDDFWCGYVPTNAQLMTPAAGYCLRWKAREVRRYREDQERQDIVEACHYLDEVKTASEAGGVLYDCI